MVLLSRPNPTFPKTDPGCSKVLPKPAPRRIGSFASHSAEPVLENGRARHLCARQSNRLKCSRSVRRVRETHQTRKSERLYAKGSEHLVESVRQRKLVWIYERCRRQFRHEPSCVITYRSCSPTRTKQLIK